MSSISFDGLRSGQQLEIGCDNKTTVIVEVTEVGGRFLQTNLVALNGRLLDQPQNAVLVFAALSQHGPITPEMRGQVMQEAVRRVEQGLVMAMMLPGGNNLSRVASVSLV